MNIIQVRERLAYLRSQIEAECISYSEILELQGLVEHIEEGDTQLLEWAGVSESDGRILTFHTSVPVVVRIDLSDPDSPVQNVVVDDGIGTALPDTVRDEGDNETTLTDEEREAALAAWNESEWPRWQFGW